ncbi:MAG: hypothetical protein F4Y84_06715 [Caldilineaceae bacterium SB0665_bin_25]|nr:hypothetical protein [Caldilineaceae bacterium SB0665_bin_25]
MGVTLVRTQIADNPVDGDGNAVAANQVFSDAEIEAFISQAGGNLLLAAANALRALAANEALVMKKIRVEGEMRDGAAVSEALRKTAFDLEMLATGPEAGVW